MKRKFGTLLTMILVGVLVISILAGCSNNGQVPNSSGQTANQPTKTPPSTTPKAEVKNLTAMKYETIDELGIFADSKIWEGSVIGSDKRLYFNAKPGEEITFPFDVKIVGGYSNIAINVVDSDTKIKTNNKMISGFRVIALQPQKDGTYAESTFAEICFANKMAKPFGFSDTFIVKAGDAITTVPEGKLYMANDTFSESVANNPNVLVYLTGNTMLGLDKVKESKVLYKKIMIDWLKFDKDAAVGDGA